MTAPTLTYAQVKALAPNCPRVRAVACLFGGARNWTNGVTAAQARAAGVPFDDIVSFASLAAVTDADIARRLRLWMADCAARVLHIYESTVPYDSRPRAAIIAARQYARGAIGLVELMAASEGAWDAANDATMAELWNAANAARAAAGAAGWDAARAAARAVDAVRAAERSWQFDRLVAWLGDNEPEEWPLPEIREAAS